ncbi:hypothetical protein COCON_G00039170 [Conger conger]|uniref:Ewing's tumor-associated antigen 1-like n=1 Tax=Conger conger TaxID=82655 RepID=A0A9Q1E088_CONCO|nr:hypothetical protein COCON_G00039170 [Conger conger]
MNERRKHLSSASGSEDHEVKHSQNKLKTNRLSRSLRQTQQSPSSDSSYNCHKDFKTPKRHTRIRHCASHNADSPSNDSDLQQDIIWDPTSPTAVCNGKGVKKSSTNVRAVDISEIANRIAPKNERPIAPEPSLLQWIGDTAVPCTPEVPQPRTRTKSTRQNDVEDLMKLAKQFDFNMHQQDKEQDMEQVREAYEGGAEADTDDLREPGGLVNHPLPSRSEGPASGQAPASQTRGCAKPATPARGPAGQVTDDFNALFDAPTQRISGRLSQISSGQSPEGRAPAVAVSRKGGVFGNVSPGSFRKPGGGSRTPTSSRVDDDWGDDDLLDDSIVLEMTQNPELFATPKHCSTQIGPSPKQNTVNRQPGAPGRTPKGNSAAKGLDGLYPGKNPKSKNRNTFKLETNPDFHVKESLSGEEQNSGRVPESGRPGQPGGLQRPNGPPQPHKPAPLEPPINVKTQTVPSGGRVTGSQRPVAQRSSSTTTSTYVTRPVQASGRVPAVHGTEIGKTGPRKPAEGPEPVDGRPVDAMEDDLDSLFASDSLWDDDDDLLCQVCEDVEKLSESQTPGTAPLDPAPAPVRSTKPSTEPSTVPLYPAPTGLRPSPPSLAAKGPVAQNVYAGGRGQVARPSPCSFSRSVSVPGSGAAFPKTVLGSLVRNISVPAANCTQGSASFPQGSLANRAGPYKFTQLKTPTPGARWNAAWNAAGNLTSSARNAAGPRPSSFKRHLSDPVALTQKVFVPNLVPVRCSEAEIERKKQEAIARRRVRMQMSQKHGGPT